MSMTVFKSKTEWFMFQIVLIFFLFFLEKFFALFFLQNIQMSNQQF